MAWFVSNSIPTENQKKNNAFELLNFVQSRNGSPACAAALCANAEKESYLNPGVWQNLTVGTGGYGLFQWDPSSKLTNWCAEQNIPSANGDSQMRCLYEHTVALGQWFNINLSATHKSDWLASWYMPWSNFLASDATPSYLAGVFVCSFERPGAILYGDRASQEKEITARGELADKWYQILTGEKPPLPPEYGWEFLPVNIKRGVYSQANHRKKRRRRYVFIYR